MTTQQHILATGAAIQGGLGLLDLYRHTYPWWSFAPLIVLGTLFVVGSLALGVLAVIDACAPVSNGEGRE